MIELEIAIDLIVPDNTAYTVLVALRQLSYKELERVERSEIVVLGLDAAPSEVERIVKRVAHAEILFNPNKHRMSYTLAANRSDDRGADGVKWEALVSDRDDNTSGLVKMLAGPFGLRELRSLSRGVAWRLYEKSGDAPRERVEWACRELLANPYSQRFHVRPNHARTAAGIGAVE
jgi:phosphoribosylformylglycinamidine (FGAM) synthase PurS component